MDLASQNLKKLYQKRKLTKQEFNTLIKNTINGLQ